MANNAQTLALSRVERVSLQSRSMFVATPIYRLNDADETIVFGLRLPVLLPANGDMSVKVSAPEAGRLDLIAQQLYGQASGWWALADVSDLIDPLAGVTTGLTLRAPNAGRLPT